MKDPQSFNWANKSRNYPGAAAAALPMLAGLVLGFMVSRVAFGILFPRWLWLGGIVPSLSVALVVSLLCWSVWRFGGPALVAQGTGREFPNRAKWLAAGPFVPLLLNLIWLIGDPGRFESEGFLLATSVWLTVLAWLALFTRSRWRGRLGGLLAVIFLAPIYLLTLGRTVGTADTFEFQVVIPRLGIVHPSGYPLYLLLTRALSLVPFNSMAWRINLATAFYGLVAAVLLYWLLWRMTGRMLPAALAAVLFGLTPTFWSQAVEAEVYTLHALLVAAALLLMYEMVTWVGWGRMPAAVDGQQLPADRTPFLPAALAFVLGLGLANHLTMAILLLPALLTLVRFFLARSRYHRLVKPNALDGEVLSSVRGHGLNRKKLLLILLIFLAPLSLYLYLPVRWAAVNGEPMGVGRFIDWVLGGRFQGALQFTAWLDDPARFAVVGRLFQDEWASVWLWIPMILGLIYSFRRWRWYAAILTLTWLGYAYYALIYHVPDLSVFIIPAHMVMAAFWGLGLAGISKVLQLLISRAGGRAWSAGPLRIALFSLAFTPGLLLASGRTWERVDRSDDRGQTAWGRAVLSLELEQGAAILADSDKFPPLYYLQQAEGLRPDLDIVLLPDESAYRAELETRIALGQTVYLARFLPGLEGVYHLSSKGPLIHVDPKAKLKPPAGASPVGIAVGTTYLEAIELEPSSPLAYGETAVTFYWRVQEPIEQVLHVYSRWAGQEFETQVQGQHPANNTYPTIAWQPGEVVADFHTIPRPALTGETELELQVALAPPFTKPTELDWHAVTSSLLSPPRELTGGRPLRVQLGDALLEKVRVSEQARFGSHLTLVAHGYGESLQQVELTLRPFGGEPSVHGSISVSMPDEPSDQPLLLLGSFPLPQEGIPGPYTVWASMPGADSVCGWLARRTEGCSLAQIELGGVSVPPGATNFDDKIALLGLDLAQTTLVPHGQLPVELTWQGLAPMDQNYTIFLQVLDGQDRIVGQIDSWPLQGTFPTEDWDRGRVVEDTFVVQLKDELPPGPYRLHVGWYLLETLRRLPVLDRSGNPIDDKVVVTGLEVMNGS